MNDQQAHEHPFVDTGYRILCSASIEKLTKPPVELTLGVVIDLW